MIYSNAFEKDFKRLPEDLTQEIAKSVLVLEESPFSGQEIKKIKTSKKNDFRLKVGAYRVLYRVKENKVYLLRAINRKDFEKTLRPILELD